ncbi:hypothetical protein [Pseudodesulfovibrio sediminis]|uniref:hypothetical protein n=1 Tax=Pseudodesulfovibrio sediminis TaxID=2810563 RepID=UPI001E378482|nr:hypothetical protein [Pseudodesulfovibrio sediminis]
MRKLRAVVCTFPSPERLGGVVDLMESGHHVSEYWLPESLAVMTEHARAFNGDWAGWCARWGWSVPARTPAPALWETEASSSDRSAQGAAMLLGLGMGAAFGWVPENEIMHDPLELMLHLFEEVAVRVAGRWGHGAESVSHGMHALCRVLPSGGDQLELGMVCGRMLYAEAASMPIQEMSGRRMVVQSLALAAMTALQSLRCAARVRFFRQTGKRENQFIANHPFKCLNGMEVPLPQPLSRTMTPAAMAVEVKKISNDDEGLVYQYGTAECGVLFGGHARMAFLKRGTALVLDRPTVITAPKQGGIAMEAAYGRIVSRQPEKDIWVRTHYSYKRRVSNLFRAQQNTVCLHNCMHRTVNEILLVFHDGRWTCLAGGGCVCS